VASGGNVKRQRGFTLVELIVVMIVLGVIAVTVLPRFADRSAFETRGFVDQTLATLQYARKVAVASGRNVCVSASSGGNTLTMSMATARGAPSACVGSNVVSNPAAKWRTYSGTNYGSALSTTFGGDGAATSVASFVVSVSGVSTYTIVVESTGYAHCSSTTPCE